MSTEHSTQDRSEDISDKGFCCLCKLPISKGFYATLSGGEKVCEACIFAAMQERREKNAAN